MYKFYNDLNEIANIICEKVTEVVITAATVAIKGV